jgi:hypothetical protein
MRFLTTVLLAGIAIPLQAADPVDLSKVERKIAKEPEYTSKAPLYGLVVFGPRADTQVWMVLDQAKADADVYDVLYADLNGNGDLTEAGERFTTENKNGSNSHFTLPDFTDPNSKLTHTRFTLGVTRGERPIFMVSLWWRGKLKYGGGYAEVPDKGYMRFARRALQAPIVWINGDGPFRFQRWYSGTLGIGQADDFKVFLGQQGVGTNSFSSFQCHALPANEHVLATLIYQDKEGKEQRVRCKLEQRC